MKVYIDPRSSINYSSYYIQGLYDVTGKKNVRFSASRFRDLKEIDMLLALVVVDAGKRKKIIIDYRDQCDVILPAYDWADLYAIINFNATTLPEGRVDKLLNIPPSFSIRIWNTFELLFHLFVNFFTAKIITRFRHKNIHLRPEIWVRNYLTLLKRQKLHDYTAENELKKENYVFFISTWWEGQTHTNAYRSHYLLSCAHHPEIDFEGGFFYNKKHMPGTLNDIRKNIPEALIYDRYISSKIYTGKTKESIFVFNTPAVNNCHGWKLGEFLSMGKAIISTPLGNEMPVPLEHGKEIFIAKDQEEIENAVDLLLNNKNLRHSLEKNAKTYFNQFASPDRVIAQIIKCAFTPSSAATAAEHSPLPHSNQSAAQTNSSAK
ncbi:MAG: hypothetical protein LBB64_02715 [Dysgonamonadaceae bacterium]|jgi:glycosyltransferase involved in cell wall biosynthesis|nr:hypothetical protein [Dysgonamonadaceae bacterium]